MSYSTPEPGRYRRIKDGAAVQVFGCSGVSALDSVTVKAFTKGARTTHVRLENFWRKYEPITGQANESPAVTS